LKKLQNAADIVLEPFRKCSDIMFGKQWLEIGWTRRKTPNNLDVLFSLEHSWNLVAGQKHREFPIRRCNPFRKFALGMWIGPINFIQNQTHGHFVSSKEGRNTSCMPTGLRELLDVRKAAHGL
jgi:hypothetical protein